MCTILVVATTIVRLYTRIILVIGLGSDDCIFSPEPCPGRIVLINRTRFTSRWSGDLVRHDGALLGTFQHHHLSAGALRTPPDLFTTPQRGTRSSRRAASLTTVPGRSKIRVRQAHRRRRSDQTRHVCEAHGGRRDAVQHSHAGLQAVDSSPVSASISHSELHQALVVCGHFHYHLLSRNRNCIRRRSDSGGFQMVFERISSPSCLLAPSWINRATC